MARRQIVEIDGLTGEVEALPPFRARYRAKLDTVNDCKREMAKIYRECRTGDLDAIAGTKLVWILQAVAKCIESGDLEKRIELLEGLNK